jgi:hypothetical protein
LHLQLNDKVKRIGRAMVRMLTSSVVDCGFEPQSGKTKDYKLGICCFSAKHAVLRRMSKDWLALNRDVCVIISYLISFCFVVVPIRSTSRRLKPLNDKMYIFLILQ